MLAIGILFMIAALILTPIRFRALGYVGLVPEAFSCFSVRFGKIPVFSAILTIARGELKITNRKGREILIRIAAEAAEPNSLISHLDNGMLSIANVRQTEIYVTAGVANNAFATAMATGGIRAVLGAGVSIAKSHWLNLSAVYYVETDYNTDVLELSVTVLASLSIAELLYGLGAAVARKINTARRNHESVAVAG